jgi:hypothetical protein
MEPTFFILFNTPEYNATPIYTIYLLFSPVLVPHMTINLIETIKIKISDIFHQNTYTFYVPSTITNTSIFNLKIFSVVLKIIKFNSVNRDWN